MGDHARKLLLACSVLLAACAAQAQSVHMLIKPLADPAPISATVVYFQGGHEVILTYTQSPDAPANPTLSYKIYESTTTCAAATTFTNVGAAAAGVLTFTDTNGVVVGQTRCYGVTSVLNGIEGVMSGTAQAVIPPSPPSGLNAKGS